MRPGRGEHAEGFKRDHTKPLQIPNHSFSRFGRHAAISGDERGICLAHVSPRSGRDLGEQVHGIRQPLAVISVGIGADLDRALSD